MLNSSVNCGPYAPPLNQYGFSLQAVVVSLCLSPAHCQLTLCPLFSLRHPGSALSGFKWSVRQSQGCQGVSGYAEEHAAADPGKNLSFLIENLSGGPQGH